MDGRSGWHRSRTGELHAGQRRSGSRQPHRERSKRGTSARRSKDVFWKSCVSTYKLGTSLKNREEARDGAPFENSNQGSSEVLETGRFGKYQERIREQQNLFSTKRIGIKKGNRIQEGESESRRGIGFKKGNPSLL